MRYLVFAACMTMITLTKPIWAEGESKNLAVFKPALSDDFKVMLKEADPATGEQLFMRKCSSCHDHKKEGGHGKGPHLWNIMGRKAGKVPGFEFSDAMRNSGHTWTLATLNYYLTNTERAVPGRIMNFRGIRRDKVRARLLAFMRTINDAPPPLS